MTPKKSKPLKIRFKIQKKRIDSDIKENIENEGDFSPDKIIYLEIDDEITNVFDLIKRASEKNIALIIPKKAAVLQSVINLKILKKKIDELKKNVVIITSDATGLQFAEKAGIPAIEHLFEKTKNAAMQSEQKPLMRGERPQRFKEEKVSIAQVIRGNTEKNDFISSFTGRIKDYLKKRKKAAQETKLVFVTPNKQALFTLILVSILLLLAIAYIALPGATIYITPRSTILDPSFNVTFLDFEKNRDLIVNDRSSAINIGSYPVDPPPFVKKINHPATGKLFKGQNAKGIITITNLNGIPWELAPRTRFQNKDGIIFRIADSVRVPPARAGVPGKLDVNVTADEFDANGQVTGERGNIEPSKFFLPGFKNQENRDKLYGESKNPMTGGITQTVKTVTKEDIAAATESAKKEITATAIEDLKKYLEQENLIKKTNLSLLTDKNVIQVSEPIITVPDILGKALDQFDITITYTAKGIAYDKQDLIETLKKRLLNRIDPDKKVLNINDDDISYKYLDGDSRSERVRLTATMRAEQIYELDPEKENGHRFIKKITDHILGMRISDALAYLQQQTDEIARADIKTWPVWAPTIPNIADNIKFVIIQEEEEILP